MSTTLVDLERHDPNRRGRYDIATNVPRAFRLRRAPALEPPFDDERDINDVFASWAPPGTTRSSVTGAARSSAVVAAPPSAASAHAASRYVQVCLEVLNGFRPPSHLRTLAGPVEVADMLRQLKSRRNGAWRAEPSSSSDTSAAAVDRRAQASATARTLSGRRMPPNERPAMAPVNQAAPHAAFRLLRLRVSEPLPDKAEVVAVIASGAGSVAIAMRLELRKASWVCVVFQVV